MKKSRNYSGLPSKKKSFPTDFRVSKHAPLSPVPMKAYRAKQKRNFYYNLNKLGPFSFLNLLASSVKV